ncbi:hypothetical protein FD723_40515 (plasmid) [Nostoc sp. C052]|uniref:hypothetical protein n=1 Tax=Nostoc sp. C052 TaxID=2576902 RepID=UPI0015C346CC|nr:hypothetical protein [Nostoc sp. C052]QLE46498.1 hypothetical protein FD723_40515 [Nostoc sp. C052]
MSNKIFFEVIEGLPEDYGTYIFLMKDNSIQEGYYGSFPHPHNNACIKTSDIEGERFYYEESSMILGWLRKYSMNP